MSTTAIWITARATGLVAYALMTATMLAGLTLAGRARPRWTRPADIFALHRWLSLTTLFVIVAHGLTLALDATMHFPIAGILVPGLTPYRPVWTGLGIAGAWVALAVYLSFRLRPWIGTRWWRRLHWATYVGFVAASAHGLASGTDSAQRWAIGIYAGAVAAVVTATVWRAGVERASRRRPSRAAST
jgi:methionine sulfoxide reductase heme-binding subunit